MRGEHTQLQATCLLGDAAQINTMQLQRTGTFLSAGRRLWPRIVAILQVGMPSTKNYHLLAFDKSKQGGDDCCSLSLSHSLSLSLSLSLCVSLCLFVCAV